MAGTRIWIADFDPEVVRVFCYLFWDLVCGVELCKWHLNLDCFDLLFSVLFFVIGLLKGYRFR